MTGYDNKTIPLKSMLACLMKQIIKDLIYIWVESNRMHNQGMPILSSLLIKISFVELHCQWHQLCAITNNEKSNRHPIKNNIKRIYICIGCKSF